jgi:hypothetical protein
MESIETLNDRLVEYFGVDTLTGHPIFRIVWANDQVEKRLMPTLDSGVQLLYPAVREVKKYPYAKDLYLLERLVVVPEADRAELADVKQSYEPIWAYCNDNREPIPPIWPATKFIVDTLYAALGKKSLRKYIDDEKNTTPEGREQKISELAEELFGNETTVGDALAYKDAVVVPRNYEKES